MPPAAELVADKGYPNDRRLILHTPRTEIGFVNSPIMGKLSPGARARLAYEWLTS